MTGERTLSAAREYKASCFIHEFTSNIQEMFFLMIQHQGCLNDMSTCSLMTLMDCCDSHDGIFSAMAGLPIVSCWKVCLLPQPKVPKSDFFILLQIQQHNKLKMESLHGAHECLNMLQCCPSHILLILATTGMKPYFSAPAAGSHKIINKFLGRLVEII